MNALLLSDVGKGLLWLLGILLFFGIIVVVIIIVRKNVPAFKSQEGEKKTEEEVAQEELDRILVPIEDENTIEALEKSEEKENK